MTTDHNARQMKKLIAAVAIVAVSTAQAATIHVDVANCPTLGAPLARCPYNMD